MKRLGRKTKQFCGHLGESVKSRDAFGTKVSVNYKGEETYKSICGGALTLIIIIGMIVLFAEGITKMVNRDQPEYASYFLPRARGPDDPLNIPSYGG